MKADPKARAHASTTDELAQIRPLVGRTLDALRIFFARLLRVREEDKPTIYAGVFQGAEFADLNYWLEIVFAIGIATLGLIINSPAVVIGAMMISPLIGPIIASGLAIALGDFYLGMKALLGILLSIVGSVFLAAILTWILPFRSPTPEILARVQPTLLDLGIAVLSGMAGAIVVCRGGRGGGVTALPGVAVAVALMPPLGVVGFGMGIGWDWSIIRGGGLLFLTNLVAIIFSSFLVFFSVRMDTTAARLRINEWLETHEKGEGFYEIIERTPLRRLLGKVGSLPRRVLILFIFLVMVAFPLQRTLNRLRQEAQIRRVVLDELHRMIPREAVFREDIEILADRVRVRVVAMLPEGFPGEKRRRLEELLGARAGRIAQVTVYDVTTRDELEALTGRLAPVAQPALETSEMLRAKFWAQVRPAIALAWPTSLAPLLSYRVTLDPESPLLLVHLVYLADQDLGDLGRETIRKALRERLGTAAIEIALERLSSQQKLAFRPRRDDISRESRQRLDELAEILRRFPQARCAIVVSAPKRGEFDELGKRRSAKIQKYLVDRQSITIDRLPVEPSAGPRDTVLLRLVPPPQP